MAIERTIRYSGKEVTILWKPHLCMHSRKCFTGLPAVFKPLERPWVNADGASAQLVIDQVRQCPSGALSIATDDAPATADPSADGPVQHTHIKVSSDGPLLVEGTIAITHPDGRVEERPGKCALCRCGASANKPFCDGSHRRVGFKG